LLAVLTGAAGLKLKLSTFARHNRRTGRTLGHRHCRGDGIDAGI
jgi:hypothetical protein